MCNRKKIIIGHPFWGRGGAEFATMWLIQVLKERFQVFIITRGGWNLEDLNKCSGTSVSEDDIKLIKLPFANILKQTKGGVIWNAIFYRACRVYGKRFDIRVSAATPINWGINAVHFLADVVWNKELKLKYGNSLIVFEVKWVRYILSRLAAAIEGTNKWKLKEDIYIANSNWTAKISSQYCNNTIRVIYPPVSNISKSNNWDSRKNDFVYLGRISEEKKIKKAIEIIEAVRNLGYLINFHIVGKLDSSDYSNNIFQIAEDRKDWLILHGSKYGEDKSDILSSFKFGINCCERESFGISTVEMIKCGMIPFIDFNSGQKEIVMNDMISFKDDKDAINKICDLVEDKRLQKEVLIHLKKQSQKFNNKTFHKEVLDVFKQF